jgi:PiT family inorganic phosphate transporter
MVSGLLALGLLISLFVGFNIGGSSTSVAFGPAVGSNTVSKLGAAALMTGFALLGGATVGRNVITTLSEGLVPQDTFTLAISIVVLLFVGLALFLSNVVGVPASTSMTAVGAIAGLGIATGTLNWAEMGRIVTWWIVSPLLAFWVSGVIGRYLYPTLVEWFAVTQTEGSLVTVERTGLLPRLRLGPNTTRREFVGTSLVVAIACYMAFSAGASNIPNAVAPLVGGGVITTNQGILIGAAGLGLGAFTIARRTLDTVGNDLTELPLLAALLVAVVSSTIVAVLSELGVPASFVIIATMSIVGLGWGRATRTTTVRGAVTDDPPDVSVGALAAETDEAPTVGGDRDDPDVDTDPIGDEDSEEMPAASDLFEPGTTARVILLQNVVPMLSTIGAYIVFRYAPWF